MTTATMDNPMTALEVRFGLQPIGDLLEERGTLIDRVAMLRAKYGAFGTWDHERKIRLAAIKGRIRAQMQAAGAKVTNDHLDDLAHADPDYTDFVITATLERADWVRLEAQVDAIDAKINRGQAVARLIGPGGRNG